MRVELKNVGHRYDKTVVLHQLNLRLQPGEFLFVTGRSGIGKSTLLRLIGALEFPQEGEILLDGHRTISSLERRLAMRQKVGFVLQNPILLEDRSLFENVALPLHIQGANSKRIQRRVNSALEAVELSSQIKKPIRSLSVGQRQRAALARAVVASPKLLLADEPTGNLDYRLASDIMRLFVRFAKNGTTVVVATHDLPLIQKMKAPCLVLFEKGKHQALSSKETQDITPKQLEL